MPAPRLLRSSFSGSVSPFGSDAPSSTRAGCVAALARRTLVAGRVETVVPVVGATASTEPLVDGASPTSVDGASPTSVVGELEAGGGVVCAVSCGWGFQLGFFWYM